MIATPRRTLKASPAARMIWMLMLANGCALAVAIAVAGCGKGGSWECISKGHGGAYDECAASGNSSGPSAAEKAAKKRDEDAKAARLRAQQERKRRDYEAAKPVCARGDAKACWAVAVYALENGHPTTEILPALDVACTAKNADACFEHGRLSNDVTRLATACELGHLRACQVAVAKDPSRATALDPRACELHDGAACERVAASHAARGDRAEAEKFLKLACREDRKAACQRLGEMAVGLP